MLRKSTKKTCFPPQNEIFNAFRYTKYEDLKVVILGQDPYHGDNQAEGLSFSVKILFQDHLLYKIYLRN